MRTNRIPPLSLLVLLIGLVPSLGLAQALSLEEFCISNGELWDAETSTCFLESEGSHLPFGETLYIEADERWVFRNDVFAYSLNGVVFNAGEIVVESDVVYFTTLVNTGKLIIDETAGAVAVGLGLRPSANAGLIENSALFVAGFNFDNAGDILNNGHFVNEWLLQNRGRIENGGGTITNNETGVINNYRCPGVSGVVTAGIGAIENNGTINYITGRECR